MTSIAKSLRRRVHSLSHNFFIHAQVSLLGSMAIVALTAGQSPVAGTYNHVLALAAVLVVITLLALVPPWESLAQEWLIVWGAVDFVIIVALRTSLESEQPGLSILALIPVLWMSFSLGLIATITASIGTYVVSLSPYLLAGTWPPSSSAWGAATLLPAIIGVGAVAIYLASARLTKQRASLLGANEQLRISIERTRDANSTAVAVVDTVDAGITFYAEDGTILLSNDSARALAVLAGRTSEGRISPLPFLFYEDRVTAVPPEDSISAQAARGDLATGRTFWAGAGETQRAVIATAKPVRRASGELIGTVVATHDVTDLLVAIHSRDEFIATVSHELRTPLTSIVGYLEVIEDGVDTADEGIAEAFASVNRNSQRLASLIESLLAEAAGSVPSERAMVDIPELVMESVDRMRSVAEAAEVRIEVAQSEGVQAEVDRASIGQVVDGLLSNAIKFSIPGSTVSITVEQQQDHAVIRVIDSGSGISTADEDHVFERFFRGQNARTSVTPGAGLGLSKAKRIVDAHRGQISVQSQERRGTTLEVRLPLLVV